MILLLTRVIAGNDAGVTRTSRLSPRANYRTFAFVRKQTPCRTSKRRIGQDLLEFVRIFRSRRSPIDQHSSCAMLHTASQHRPAITSPRRLAPLRRAELLESENGACCRGPAIL